MQILNHSAQHPRRVSRLAVVVLTCTTLAACASRPVRHYRSPVIATHAPATPATTVYVYPASGQSPEQLDRDRYECHQWSVSQTGYDPSRRHADAERVEVVSAAPPGSATVGGTVVGAVLGAAIAGRHATAGGAIVGGIAGAMVGASVDADRQAEVDRVQAGYDRRSATAAQQAQAYRRAISACLEGRGYTVQ